MQELPAVVPLRLEGASIMQSIWTWAFAHAGTLILLLLFVVVMAWIIGAAVYAIWLRQETRMEDEQRQRLLAAIALTEILDRECGRVPPAAPGINRRRVS